MQSSAMKNSGPSTTVSVIHFTRHCLSSLLMVNWCCCTVIGQEPAAPQPGAAAAAVTADAASVFQKDEVDLAMDRAVAWLQTKQRKTARSLTADTTPR
jgi:hypothetical protein